MRYRTFTGKTKQEAFAALNEEKKLDPSLRDARLIKDSESTISSFLGLKNSKVYEIVVGIPEHSNTSSFPNSAKLNSSIDLSKFSAIENSVINKQRKKIDNSMDDTLFAIQGISKVAEQISKLENPAIPNSTPKPKTINSKTTPSLKEVELKKELNAMKNEFKELKLLLANQQNSFSHSQLLESLQENKELPNEFQIQQQHMRWIEKYLLEREFSQELIDDILTELENYTDILNDKNKILKVVEEFLLNNIIPTNINLDDYNYGSNIIFIGSTGVGKTSTIVKLAAHLSLMRKRSFRFISVDRYKIGGETQLEKLAGYMNAQFHAINKKEEFFELLSTKTVDFTFIDTAGKAPKENMAIQELGQWISMTGTSIDTHLVLSATTKVSDLESICEAYNGINYSHFLITKLDETKTFGSIISLAYKYQKPLSFITDGQEIPQDFEIADSTRLIKESLK